MIRVVLTLKLIPPTEDQLLALQMFGGNTKILFRYEVDVKGVPIWADCLSDTRRLIEMMINGKKNQQADAHFELETGEKVEVGDEQD